jgi:hypothetical protein
VLGDGLDSARDVSQDGFEYVVLQDPADKSRKIEADNLFKALLTIDIPHHEIHEGDMWEGDFIDLVINKDAILDVAFKTPDTAPWAHLIARFVSISSGHLEILEAPVWDAGTGTQAPFFNRNRNFDAKISGMLEDTTGAFIASNNFILNPTVTVPGTVIKRLYSFAARVSAGGQNRADLEWVLRQNTTYILRYISDSNNNSVQLFSLHYEHTNE